MNTGTIMDEIKRVTQVTRDGGSYCVRCPHCQRLIGVEGEDLDEVRGEQFRDPICRGWLEVSQTAAFVRELTTEAFAHQRPRDSEIHDGKD